MQESIQIALLLKEKQTWLDATAISIWASVIQHNGFRPMIGIICDFNVATEKFSANVYDALGDARDCWRYKDSNLNVPRASKSICETIPPPLLSYRGNDAEPLKDFKHLFHLTKPIQVSVQKGNSRLWCDAKVLSVWADMTKKGRDYRALLNLICEFYVDGTVNGMQILDAYGDGEDSWRYKDDAPVTNTDPPEHQLGDQVYATRKIDGTDGAIQKGAMVTIIEVDPVHGYGIEDEAGIKVLNCGWDCVSDLPF